MYNAKIKENYIKEKLSYTTAAKYFFHAMFEHTEKFEEELGKDCSEFTYYEIVNMYKTLNVTSIDYLKNIHSNLNMYTSWCINHSLVRDFQNHYLEVQKDELRSFLNQTAINTKIVNRDTVLEWCSQLPNPSDQFCILGLFEGIKGNAYMDLANAKVSDFENSVFTGSFSGKTITVSNQLIDYARQSSETLDYIALTGKMERVSPLLEDERILKPFNNVTAVETPAILRRRINTRLVRIFDFLGISRWFIGNDLTISGRIAMIKDRSKFYNMSCHDYIYSDYIQEVEYRYEKRIVRSEFWKRYEKYLV